MPEPPRGAAVRNLEQWAKARFSYVEWGKCSIVCKTRDSKTISDCKPLFTRKIMTCLYVKINLLKKADVRSKSKKLRRRG